VRGPLLPFSGGVDFAIKSLRPTSHGTRASGTQLSDSLVRDSMCKQGLTVCSNASFTLVSCSLVSGCFPSYLYHICTLLTTHAYPQVEIAMQVASRVGMKGYHLLSGPLLYQNLDPKL